MHPTGLNDLWGVALLNQIGVKLKIDKRISAEKRRKILDEQRYYHARIEMMYEEMIYELSELLGLKESTIQKVLDESP